MSAVADMRKSSPFLLILSAALHAAASSRRAVRIDSCDLTLFCMSGLAEALGEVLQDSKVMGSTTSVAGKDMLNVRTHFWRHVLP